MKELSRSRKRHVLGDVGLQSVLAKTLVRVGFAVVLLIGLGRLGAGGSTGVLRVTVLDRSTDMEMPARILLTDDKGSPVSAPSDALAVPGSVVGIPSEALATMYGRSDRAEGFARLPDGAFYVGGNFSLDLPPGSYTLQVSKGYEYRSVTNQVEVEQGSATEKEVRLERWIDMPARGWYSADDHIHLRRSPRENPVIAKWLAAEDIHVGNLLQMGDYWATYYSQYGWGEQGRYEESGRWVSSGQEDPRTPEIGHTISLAAEDFVRFSRDYYSYDKVFDRVHELGGITGYAHQGMSFNGFRGMAMDVIEQKIDFLELLQFCVEDTPLHLTHYYHYLDLGFRLTALAGSDFPWCGRGPQFGVEDGCAQIGNARFYTRVNGPLTFNAWYESVRAGHTFVSSGPMLEFSVNGGIAGDTVDLNKGDILRVRAEAFGDPEGIPLEKLEVVGHGTAIRTVTADGAGDRASLVLEFEIPVEHGIWLAARCEAGPTQMAHTTPVYVTVDGGGFHNPDTVHEYLDLTAGYLKEVEVALEQDSSWPDQRISHHAAAVRNRLARVRGQLDRLRTELSAQGAAPGSHGGR